MKYIYMIICFSVFVSCKNDTEKIDTKQQEVKDTTSLSSQSHVDTAKPAQSIIGPAAPNKYIASTFKLDDGTIGYDISNADGKKIIHQDRLPGMPGLRGFENESQANCVAEMMMEKLSKGIMPPSISIDDLKHCGVKTK